MPVEQIEIQDFLKLAEDFPVFDVRSPGEFLRAHMPGALPLPLFNDEQRKIIGTAYKQQSRKAAVQIGLEYFSRRMMEIREEVKQFCKKLQEDKEDKTVMLHCWRGGMRSNSVAWLLDLYGYHIYILKGGYKTYRNWVLAQFEKKYSLNILGGYTGSGKTDVLERMEDLGVPVIDLERLANHKGSAFGSLGEAPQPTQEMFENLLAAELCKENRINSQDDPSATQAIWLEDESRHIGRVGIPLSLWNLMRTSNLYFLEIPFDRRLDYIISTYGSFEKDQIIICILKIEKRLGGLETKNAINFLIQENPKECFTILLKYYDKLYANSLLKRENIDDIFIKTPSDNVDINIADKLVKASNTVLQ